MSFPTGKTIIPSFGTSDANEKQKTKKKHPLGPLGTGQVIGQQGGWTAWGWVPVIDNGERLTKYFQCGFLWMCTEIGAL
jgi:hypothetical protein